MEDMYIYRVQKAFEEFGTRITDAQALDFQKIYADRQRHIHMSEQMEAILEYCRGKAELGIITNGPSVHQWNKVKSLAGRSGGFLMKIYLCLRMWAQRSRTGRFSNVRNAPWGWKKRQSGLSGIRMSWM